MCCHGCQAVARAILAAGHGDFYRYRTGNAPTGRELLPEFLEQTRLYDHPEVQKTFVRRTQGSGREAALILEGITCAACIWLNERHISELPGVLEVQINYATHRAHVCWDEERIRLSDILQAIQAIGYQAHPYNPQQQQQALERERRTHLLRLGVAAVLGMQVMILSVALYFGEWSGMESGFRDFFRWLGLGLTTPVLLYSAVPFFRGAWRDLRHASIGMDVPVALGILVAFLGSVHATWSGHGEVYYDSVVMFVFLLLLSRYFEIMARKRGAETAERINRALPAMATRLMQRDGDEHQEVVPVAELAAGDRVLVRAGDTVPADGRIVTGRSSVSEALLTGESTPLDKRPGDELVGGSINIESPLHLVVTRVGLDSVLAQIMRLMERAQGEKPTLTQLADRTAAWFVGSVLLIACLAGGYWWQHAPDAWLPIVVSVLVITCPCALSLATPTALSAATGTLMSFGLLPARGNRLETLARCTHVVFDKTGTLTRGKPTLTATRTRAGISDARALRIAAALESQSEHPLGRAIAAAAGVTGQRARGLINHPGAGISGEVEGRRYVIGNGDFVARHTAGRGAAVPSPGAPSGARVVLADTRQVLAEFFLQDELRPEARATIAALRGAGKQVLLMTGDQADAADEVARRVGIATVLAGLKPQDKLERLQALQREGAVVVMVGDGINDAPVLAGADVSIAMHEAAHISHASADMILLSDHLGGIVDGMAVARKTLRIIRQNLSWAVAYNLTALPAAALGLVAPWMAAIGMSSSSLLVVVNALRLTRRTGTGHAPRSAAPASGIPVKNPG
jgi:Cu2+-exporting ATPase